MNSVDYTDSIEFVEKMQNYCIRANYIVCKKPAHPSATKTQVTEKIFNDTVHAQWSDCLNLLNLLKVPFYLEKTPVIFQFYLFYRWPCFVELGMTMLRILLVKIFTGILPLFSIVGLSIILLFLLLFSPQDI